MTPRIERTTCPHCGKPDYEVFEAGDGSLGSRALSHIECVAELKAELEAIRAGYIAAGRHMECGDVVLEERREG